MKTCITCNQIKTEEEFYILRPAKSRPNRRGFSSECKICFRERSKRNSTPQIKRYHMVHFKYGITKKEYDILLEKFPVCACCGNEFLNNEPTVDHCHKTNKIRGLLCINCNTGLGRFKDNKELLLKAIKYLDNTL